ncbi:MAG TPA: ribonuclease H-like domain-containing protein [Limnochordia bacterium]
MMPVPSERLRGALQRLAAGAGPGGETEARPQPRPKARGFGGGSEMMTAAGPVYLLKRCRRGTFALPGIDRLAEQLTWVRGLGPATARRLRQAGLKRIAELADHPRFGPSARRLSAALAARDVAALRDSGAAPWELLPAFSPEEMLFLDVETAGFARALPLFIAGVAWWSNGEWHLSQFLARTFDEERALLVALLEIAGRFPVIVSYNGRAFDEPFVRARLAHHRLAVPTFRLHADLLPPTRRLFGRSLPDCRLATVAAALLGRTGGPAIDGEEIGARYYEFVMSQEPLCIGPILARNADDVFTLTELARRIFR